MFYYLRKKDKHLLEGCLEILDDLEHEQEVWERYCRFCYYKVKKNLGILHPVYEMWTTFKWAFFFPMRGDTWRFPYREHLFKSTSDLIRIRILNIRNRIKSQIRFLENAPNSDDNEVLIMMESNYFNYFKSDDPMSVLMDYHSSDSDVITRMIDQVVYNLYDEDQEDEWIYE